MIISHKKKFVFLRTSKTASSSIETYLTQFCSKEDLITELGYSGLEDEEEFRKKNSLLGAQNYILKKRSYGIKNFLNFNFFNEVNVNSHDTINKILKTEIKFKIVNYFIFCFIRNPFDWIVSDFWWYLFVKKINVKVCNQSKIQEIFKNFIDKECPKFFDRQLKIVNNKYVNIKIFRYEEIDSVIKKLKKKLNLENEKISLKEISFKKLNVKNKILIDLEDRSKIIQSAKFFFDNYYQDKTLPQKYM